MSTSVHLQAALTDSPEQQPATFSSNLAFSVLCSCGAATQPSPVGPAESSSMSMDQIDMARSPPSESGCHWLLLLAGVQLS